MTTPLSATRALDLREALAGWPSLRAWSVGLDGTAYVVASRDTASPQSLVVSSTGQRVEVTFEPYLVQPYPGGVLLVGHERGARTTTRAIDWSGRTLARLNLGMPMDIRVVRDSIWAGYPEEQARGLVAYSLNGERSFVFDAVTASVESILDVQAMNVSETGEVWITYFPGDRIVRIRNGEYRTWKSGLDCTAFAIREPHAYYYFTHARRMSRIVLRDDGDVETVEELELVDDRGLAVYSELGVKGVGSQLFFLRSGEVWRVSV